MTHRIRVAVFASLLCAPGCDAPEEGSSDASATPPAGKADAASGSNITWHTLQSTGCTPVAVSNDPSGDGYVSSWLFQADSVQRCSLSGSATLPAGVEVRTMRVMGEGFFATLEEGTPASLAVDARGTAGQSILEGETERQTAESSTASIEGVESIGSGCLTAPRTFRFQTDFAVGAGTHAQFDSLDVFFDVHPCS